MRLGREVHDHVDVVVLERRDHRRPVTDVGLEEHDAVAVLDVGQIRPIPGIREQIDGHDAIFGMGAAPVADEVRADEAGGSRHQDRGHRGSLRGPIARL